MDLADILKRRPVILAPMAGITDKSFRLICRRLGTTVSFKNIPAKLTITAIARTGLRHLIKLIPPACIAIISLSAESRPKESNVATSIAIGKLMAAIPGNPNTSILATPIRGAPLLTIKRLKSSILPATNAMVNTATPNRNGPLNSDNIYLSINRLTERTSLPDKTPWLPGCHLSLLKCPIAVSGRHTSNKLSP
jgi:hypothetical protein